MPRMSLPEIDKDEATFFGTWIIFPLIIILIILFVVFLPWLRNNIGVDVPLATLAPYVPAPGW